MGWWQRADGAQGVARRCPGGGLVAGRRLVCGGLAVRKWAAGGEVMGGKL